GRYYFFLKTFIPSCRFLLLLRQNIVFCHKMFEISLKMVWYLTVFLRYNVSVYKMMICIHSGDTLNQIKFPPFNVNAFIMKGRIVWDKLFPWDYLKILLQSRHFPRSMNW